MYFVRVCIYFIVFFSNKLVVWIYNFVLVMVCFRFCEIVFVCKLLKLVVWITELDVLWWERCRFMIKKKEQNDVVLSDTVPPSSSLGRATGEDRNLCFSFISSPRAHSPSQWEANEVFPANHTHWPPRLAPSLQTTPIGHLVRRRPCKPHPLATSFSVVAGQEGPSPHAQW